MATKAKTDAKLPVLKGQEAENKILEYLRMMNRPFGAVDVSANLKGAIPKTATQKILVSLAEKGELVQKIYGKTTFFVINQEKMESMPAGKIAELEQQLQKINETIKILQTEIKSTASELAALKSSPTDEELESQVVQVKSKIENITAHLRPLRAGAPPVSAEERAGLDTSLEKWRAEWLRRKKIIYAHLVHSLVIHGTNRDRFWQLATDALLPQEAKSLMEDLGIETDTPEHLTVERDIFSYPSNSLKRKRA